MSQTAILHLSDIHIRYEGDETFDFGVVFDPLIDRVKEDREKKEIAVEFVFLTGDIAFQGKKEEYDIAANYLTRLMNELDLPTERLFIVPGNHDVNRKLYRPTERFLYDSMRGLNKELENIIFRSDLFKGQQAYFKFINNYFPHLTALDDNLIPFAQTHKTKSGHVLGFLGLNSAWMCRRSPDQGEVAIGEYQLKKAKERLKTCGNTHLNLACFHHPVSWLWKEDQDVARTYLDRFVLLTGHLHDAGGGFQNDTNGQIFSASAGGAYLGSDSKYPMGYHYLTIDWDKQVLRLDFRTFNKRKWILDSSRGTDGVAEIPCSFVDGEHHNESGDGSKSFKPNPGTVKKVQKAICDILQNRHLHYLRKFLALELHITDEPDNENLIASRLVSGEDLLDTIAIMGLAVKKSIREIRNREEKTRDWIKETWEESVNMLGHLVLLGVNADWLDAFHSKPIEHIRFEIPVKTDAGIEVLYSGITNTPARLGADKPHEKKSSFIQGLDSIAYPFPESGFDVHNTVNEIVESISGKLLPEKATDRGNLSTEEWYTYLNRILKRRKQNGFHCYLLPRQLDNHSPALLMSVYKTLKEKISHLDIILISMGDESALIVSEPEFNADLTEFFENKPEY
nr:metallophosphoesterase [uncultured Desulfobacter sp.]